MANKKKVQFMIYDTYGVLSDNPITVELPKEEHDELIKVASGELRSAYGFLEDKRGQGAGVLTGTRARSLSSLSDGTLLNDTNEDAKYKKMIYWSRDVETEGLPIIGNYSDGVYEPKVVLTSELFMWGVINQGWTYHEPEVLFGGEVKTELQRKSSFAGQVVDTSKEDTQDVQFLTKVITMFTDEGDTVWDRKGNVKNLAKVCEDLNREYIFGELDPEEWDYNEDIEYGQEPYAIDLSDLSNPIVSETTAEVDTIEHGDSFEYLDTIGDESIDLLLTDPPYNVSSETKAGSIFGNRGVNLNFGDWDFGFDTRKWVNQVAPKVRQGGMATIFNSFKNMELMTRVLEEWGYTVLGMPYWSKTNPVPHLHDRVPLNGIESYLLAIRGSVEEVNVYGNEGKVKGKVIPKTNKVYYSDRHYYSSHADQKRRFHTTQKPEDLFKEIMDLYTKRGDVVMDTFSGSGTTAVGARDMGRHFYTVEMDDTYYEKSMHRLKNPDSKRKILGFND